MFKFLFCFFFLSVGGCSSSTSESGSATPASGGAGSQNCPDVSGTWKVTAHCDASLVGMSLDVTESNCMLTFAAPFDQFMGSVSADDKVTLSGPQSCTGSVTASAISMVCTPGTCNVTLAR